MTNSSKERAENTNAIADLAIDNFMEMRDRVDDADFMLKRKIETELEFEYPDYYSKYSLVTFRADVPYARAMHQGRAQDDLLLSWCQQPLCAPKEAMHTQLMDLSKNLIMAIENKTLTDRAKPLGNYPHLKGWAILFLYLVQVVENPIIPMKVQNKMKTGAGRSTLPNKPKQS